jgi:hypothetical protein
MRYFSQKGKEKIITDSGLPQDHQQGKTNAQLSHKKS